VNGCGHDPIHLWRKQLSRNFGDAGPASVLAIWGRFNENILRFVLQKVVRIIAVPQGQYFKLSFEPTEKFANVGISA
jgi:hypothetical protein